MSIPYLGSKRTSASRIVSLVRAYYPKETRFYDLFCGGLAISESAHRHGFYVHASDVDEGMVALANEIMFGDCKDPVTAENVFEHPRFVGREEALQGMAAPNDGWWGAFLGVVWGYGNNRRNYLFNRERERMKKMLFGLVVNGKIEPNLDIPVYAQKKVAELSEWRNRRVALGRVAKVFHKADARAYELEPLERLERLESTAKLGNPVAVASYDEVSVPAGAVIYCDPPYKDTAGYVANHKGGFDHNKFYEWARRKSRTNPVFVSEYQMPDDFNLIYEFSRNRLLAGGGASVSPTEKVFLLDNRGRENE